MGAQNARTLVKNQWRTKTTRSVFFVRIHVWVAIAPAMVDVYARLVMRWDGRTDDTPSLWHKSTLLHCVSLLQPQFVVLLSYRSRSSLSYCFYCNRSSLFCRLCRNCISLFYCLCRNRDLVAVPN